MILPEKGYKRTIIITFYILLAAFLSLIFFKYLLKCVLPFMIAFLGAYCTRKIVLFLHRKFRISRFFAVISITLTILAILVFLVWILLSRGFSELSGLAVFLTESGLTETVDTVSKTIISFIKKISPELAESSIEQIQYFSNNINVFIAQAVQKALPYIANTTLGILKAFPGIFLFLGVTVLSMFYFGYDYEKITAFIKLQLSNKYFSFLSELKKQFFDAVFRIFRAYAILILITFSELWVGFLIIGIPYATILAVFTSLIDILPILGTGTVLLPFSLISFLIGNTKNAVCLIALYIIVTLVRQIAEPKILGDSVGLHPLLTLISMYFGVKLVGFSGLFIFPFAAIIIKNLNEAGIIKLYKQK